MRQVKIGQIVKFNYTHPFTNSEWTGIKCIVRGCNFYRSTTVEIELLEDTKLHTFKAGYVCTCDLEQLESAEPLPKYQSNELGDFPKREGAA